MGDIEIRGYEQGKEEGRSEERERIWGSIATVFGVPLSRIEELIKLFTEAGYDIKNNKQFKLIKRDYFKKIDKKNE